MHYLGWFVISPSYVGPFVPIVNLDSFNLHDSTFCRLLGHSTKDAEEIIAQALSED